MKKLKSIIQNIVILLITIILCVGFFELGVRIFASPPFDYATANADASVLWQADSLLGWSMQPSQQATFSRPEFTASVATNSLGLRDDEIPAEKAENELRILLLGDSVVAGFEVARDSTIEANLEHFLQKHYPDKKIQVINAGVRGYGTDQELIYLVNRGFKLQPDIVITGFVPANDLENNVTIHTAGRKFSKPCFFIDGDKALRFHSLPKEPIDINQQIYNAGFPQSQPLTQSLANDGQQSGWKQFLSTHFQSYDFLARRLKSAPPAVVGVLKKWDIIHNPLPKFQVDFYRTPIDPAWNGRWEVTQAILGRMQRACDKRGVRFMLWTFPLKEQVYTRDREIFERSFDVQPGELDFTLPDYVLENIAQQENIELVITVPTFQVFARRGYRFHYLTDHHFNEAGHRFMAYMLYERIIK